MAQKKSALLSNKLTDDLHQIQKMLHSSKVKLQAARFVILTSFQITDISSCLSLFSPCSKQKHPFLKEWYKECSHYTNDDIITYSMKHLSPVNYYPKNYGKEVTQKTETPGEEVTQPDMMKNEVQSNDGNVSLVSTGKGLLEALDRAADVVEPPKQLGASTLTHSVSEENVNEDFLNWDSIEWFLSMKLFDNVDTIYGNVKAQLNQIDTMITGGLLHN